MRLIFAVKIYAEDASLIVASQDSFIVHAESVCSPKRRYACESIFIAGAAEELVVVIDESEVPSAATFLAEAYKSTRVLDIRGERREERQNLDVFGDQDPDLVGSSLADVILA